MRHRAPPLVPPCLRSGHVGLRPVVRGAPHRLDVLAVRPPLLPVRHPATPRRRPLHRLLHARGARVLGGHRTPHRPSPGRSVCPRGGRDQWRHLDRHLGIPARLFWHRNHEHLLQDAGGRGGGRAVACARVAARGARSARSRSRRVPAHRAPADGGEERWDKGPDLKPQHAPATPPELRLRAHPALGGAGHPALVPLVHFRQGARHRTFVLRSPSPPGHRALPCLAGIRRPQHPALQPVAQLASPAGTAERYGPRQSHWDGWPVLGRRHGGGRDPAAGADGQDGRAAGCGAGTHLEHLKADARRGAPHAGQGRHGRGRAGCVMGITGDSRVD
mmetsp:Transcript_19449/g.63383  ORF Transcript_19449/g.63383 Transcript_19449/m.63383 type:complete len:332 (-) Transcript_19449:92-1087(-)